MYDIKKVLNLKAEDFKKISNNDLLEINKLIAKEEDTIKTELLDKFTYIKNKRKILDQLLERHYFIVREFKKRSE